MEVELWKTCAPLWREAHLDVKICKTHHVRTFFQSCDVQKAVAVVARNKFRGQNVQKTPFSGHFWKLRCRKSARRCGAKCVSKSKCTKHTILGPLWKLRCRKSARRCCAKCVSKSKCTKHTRFRALLEVEMSRKCAPLWHEPHFQIKVDKTHHVQNTFGRSDAVSRSRRKGLCTWVLSQFQLQSPLHYITLLHCNTLHCTTLKYNYGYICNRSYNYKTNYVTLHCDALHYTTFH